MSNVMFKGNKDGIVVMLNENTSFSIIKEELAEKSKDARKFFGAKKTSLIFKGRTLDDEEINQLVDVIKQNTDLQITFVSDNIYIEKYLKDTKKEISTPIKMQEIIKEVSEKENNTLFHKGSMRSGHAIKHSGSIVVIGDVNPGAELIGEGNIIVIGTAKGLLHAGCSGNRKCFVLALNLNPTQLRIADLITYIPKEKIDKNKKTNPSFAYVEEDKVFVTDI